MTAGPTGTTNADVTDSVLRIIPMIVPLGLRGATARCSSGDDLGEIAVGLHRPAGRYCAADTISSWRYPGGWPDARRNLRERRDMRVALVRWQIVGVENGGT